MATTLVNRGITYICNGTATTTVNLDLGLWAGVDQDETLWLDGQSTDGYPGNLSGFQASNTQVVDRRGTRLIALSMSGALADTNTLTLSGDVSKILSVTSSKGDSTASLGIVKTSDLVLTFDVEATADGTTDDLTAAELILLVI
tara:strand:+ start:779 stop:1210 length:432 start_codon:yes stop_codon:yes gene_type:complete